MNRLKMDYRKIFPSLVLLLIASGMTGCGRFTSADGDLEFFETKSYLSYNLGGQSRVELIFLDPVKGGNSFKDVASVGFSNSKCIEVEEFTVWDGDIANGLRIRTLSLIVNALKPGDEQLDELSVRDRSGGVRTYDIGHLFVQVFGDTVGNDLEVTGGYPAVTSSIGAVHFALRNVSDEICVLESIHFSPTELAQAGTTIAPDETAEIIVELDTGYYNSNVALVEPHIIYSKSDSTFRLPLPRISLGYMGVTDEVIEEELNS